MKYYNVKKELFNVFKEKGFKKNNANEIITIHNNHYIIIDFQKSDYGEDFYINLALYVPGAHKNSKENIHYDDCDFFDPQVLGPIDCEKLDNKDIYNIHNKILKKIKKEMTDINKLRKKAKKGYFEKRILSITSEFKEYLLKE